MMKKGAAYLEWIEKNVGLENEKLFKFIYAQKCAKHNFHNDFNAFFELNDKITQEAVDEVNRLTSGGTK